jgi:hypothetical protein
VTRDRVLEVARELEIDIIDTTPAFVGSSNPRSLYSSDGYFSIKGAEVVARYIGKHSTTLLGPRLILSDVRADALNLASEPASPP